jgi:hypothetical protein
MTRPGAPDITVATRSQMIHALGPTSQPPSAVYLRGYSNQIRTYIFARPLDGKSSKMSVATLKALSDTALSCENNKRLRLQIPANWETSVKQQLRAGQDTIERSVWMSEKRNRRHPHSAPAYT